jgi:predicted nucleic acid-binding protein
VGDHTLCIVPQVVYEFWVVGTRPTSENGLGLTIREIAAEIVEIKALFRVFRDERAIFPAWEHLVIDHEVRGKLAHDARLVAAMQRHEITHILTFNARDFSRFGDIGVLTPEQPVESSDRSGS